MPWRPGHRPTDPAAYWATRLASHPATHLATDLPTDPAAYLATDRPTDPAAYLATDRPTDPATRPAVRMSLPLVFGAAAVGVLVGMTGAGGGALMTPMLILLFSVNPSTAISSDLLASVAMQSTGASVHLRRATVELRIVAWLAAGSVPAAFAGAYLLHVLGHTRSAEHNVQLALGAALLAGAGGMILRRLPGRRAGFAALDGRAKPSPRDSGQAVRARPLPTLVIGALGGVVVGMTSVGAGSLIVVLLMFTYPSLGAKRLVGTSLTQAIPLTASGALGALAFGHVQLGLSGAIVAGGVPGVLAGSLVSSRVPDRFLRPAVTFVILASGLKYVGVPTAALGWVLGALLVTGVVSLGGRALLHRRGGGSVPVGVEAPAFAAAVVPTHAGAPEEDGTARE